MAQAEATGGWARTLRELDPFPPLWRLLTSVKFALFLIGFLALAGLLSVLLPQIPEPMRDNPAAVDAWVELQRGKFGVFTEPMHRLGLFNVFNARWFLGGLAVLVVSVTVCTANRFAPTWRNVTRPPERVADGFFDRAGNRASFAAGTPDGETAARLADALRRRRFKVKRFQERGAVYLFADRFAWAQLATFVSHLALIMFLAGGLISRLGGYSSALFIAEGATMPVFAVSHPNQMQVEVIDAEARFDAEGTPLDYRTELVVYQNGEVVARGTSTVNDPLSYGGYRFHQAAFFGEGAALTVRDAETGDTLYKEVLALRDLVPAPVIQVTDSEGNVLLEDIIAPEERIGDAVGAPVRVPGDGGRFWLGVEPAGEGQWRLIAYRVDQGEATRVAEGETFRAGDLTFRFVEATGLPSTTAPSAETPPVPGPGEEARAILSEDAQGAYLTVLDLVPGTSLILRPGEPVQVGPYVYEFEGRRDFAGIEVRRDPGTTFIWVASGLLLAGLAATFYLPRLRLWARVRDGEATIAGLTEKSGSFRAEVKQLARSLGVRFTRDDEED